MRRGKRREKQQDGQRAQGRMKNPAYCVLGISFVLLLFGFGVLNYYHKDRSFSDTENRMLEQKPQWQISSVLDGRFMKSFETWQTDQFIFRDGWITLRTAADRILGKKDSGGVFLGKDGSLYEKPEKLGEGVWTNLDAIRSFCQRHPELSSYLLLVPDAAGVNPEGLPDFAPVETQADQLQQISGYLGDAVLNIPVYDTLREHRQEYIYYRTDHHWTTLGAWYAYEKAASVMGLAEPEAPETPPLYPVSDSFEGTLASRSGYQADPDTISVFWPGAQTDLVVSYVEEQEESASLYASEKLKTRDQYGMFLNGNHPLVRIRTMADSKRTLLLIKDSYANCFVPFLVSQFREIVLVDPRYYYGDLESLTAGQSFTDVLFLYNLNTFLTDDVLHLSLEE